MIVSQDCRLCWGKGEVGEGGVQGRRSWRGRERKEDDKGKKTDQD
jgi:hypothetical protein